MDHIIKYSTPVILVGFFVWVYRDSRVLEVLVKLTPLIAVSVAFLAFLQAGKIFGFENRAIPTVLFLPNNEFRIVVKNAGKSPITQIKGYYRYFYQDENGMQYPHQAPFYLSMVEAGEDKSMATGLTVSHLDGAKNRILFLLVLLKSKDLKFYKNKTYAKIFYINLSTSSPYDPAAWAETDESLFAIGRKEHPAMLQIISDTKKIIDDNSVYPNSA